MANARKKHRLAVINHPGLPKKMSQQRKWFYRLVLLILSPLLFFGVVEGILWAIDFGYPGSFLLHHNENGQNRVVENSKFGWRFFGRDLARTPYPLNFPEEKPPRTVRIFVFGESAAYGDPQPDFGLPRLLEVLLHERYPDLHFEVINAAMVAINSHVILPIARDCAQEHGDIWVVYMGNNEVVGPFGGGTVFGPQAPPIALIRASLLLTSTRTGELLSDLLAHAKSGVRAPAEWRGLMMFVQNQVRQDDPRMARTYSHFEKNLSDILQTGTDSGAKVIVSTVGSNLKDCAPFGSQHPASFTVAQSNEWTRLYQMGIKADEEGKAVEATNYYAQAAKLDSHFADLQFRWARTALTLGDEKGAKEHFVLARDFDTLRFRADSRINEIIHDTATKHQDQGVFFVDAATKLANQSPFGISGQSLFYEHVHFTFDGNYALAKILADKIEESLPTVTKQLPSPHGAWLSAEECAARLGWNDWSKRQALESLQLNVPPFNFQLNHLETLQFIHREIDQLQTALTLPALRTAAADYQQLKLRAPNDWVFAKRLAEVLQEMGDLNGAANQWRAVEALAPQNIQAPLQLNLILLEQGKLEEAADEYSKAFKLDSNYTEGTYAKLLQKTGNKVLEKAGADAAIPFFRQAISLRPYFAEAHISLGSALSTTGNSNEALQEFRIALRYPPTTPQGLESLAAICYQEGWTNEATRNFEAALNLDPTDSTAHCYLGIIAFGKENYPAALKEFHETLRLAPGNAEARAYLDRISKVHTNIVNP